MTRLELPQLIAMVADDGPGEGVNGPEIGYPNAIAILAAIAKAGFLIVPRNDFEEIHDRADRALRSAACLGYRRH